MAIPSKTPAAPVPLEECLSAYVDIVARFGTVTDIKPGRIALFGWDLEYLSASNLASFIDALLVRRFNDFIPDNDAPVILDGGANIGFSVLNYRRQFPGAKIIAFEPDPRLAPILKRNLRGNGAADVEVVEAAAWTRDGRAEFRLHGADGSHLAAGEGESRDESVAVQTIDLARYLERPVDLLKLDIESAEYEVVRHLAGKMAAVKNVVIECHVNQAMMVPLAGLIKGLKEEGFEVFLNSMGVWRDLIRQPERGASRWDQYVLVSGRRGGPVVRPAEPDSLAFAGVDGALKIRKAKDKAEEEKALLGRTLAELAGILPGKAVRVRLRRPFQAGGGRCWQKALPKLAGAADGPDHPRRSPALVFEDGVLLGPAHSGHEEIRKHGGGRYSHWSEDLYFSASDGSDPNTNGRAYVVVCSRTPAAWAGRGER